MNLGVYWHFGFPTGLYSFDYFEFRLGLGGHSDSPAELITNITTKNPDKLIGQLRSLLEQHQEGFLFVYHDKNNLQIGTGSYELSDYDFHLIKEVELLLKTEMIELNNNQKLENPQLIRLFVENKKTFINPKNGFLQVVGSRVRKSNAETKSLRMDCNLSLKNKLDFIADLSKVSNSSNVNVFYYFDHDFIDKSNLMLFFTNGRQGIDFQKKQYVDILTFENKIKELLNKHNVELGHKSGYELYPKNGPKIELMIDKEYLID